METREAISGSGTLGETLTKLRDELGGDALMRVWAGAFAHEDRWEPIGAEDTLYDIETHEPDAPVLAESNAQGVVKVTRLAAGGQRLKDPILVVPRAIFAPRRIWPGPYQRRD